MCILSSNILGNLTKEASPSKVLEVRAPIAEALPRPSYTSTLKRYLPTYANSDDKFPLVGI